MTTEEKNIISIEDLDKLKSEYDLMCAYAYGHVYNDFEQYYDRDVLNRCIWLKPLYWSVIMPIWQKLRGELNNLANKVRTKPIEDVAWAYRTQISHAILSCDLPTAHRLIHEAIELIKK